MGPPPYRRVRTAQATPTAKKRTAAMMAMLSEGSY